MFSPSPAAWTRGNMTAKDAGTAGQKFRGATIAISSVSRADVSTKRLIPILTAVAIAAIDGIRTYLIEIVGFLTGICLGALGCARSALGCERSKEPTRMTKQEALGALWQRQANRPERIDSDAPGAPTFLYCEICGALAVVHTAVWRDRSSFRYWPPPSELLCEACCEMKNAGWLKQINRPIAALSGEPRLWSKRRFLL
jgi:hypothetical protein